MSDAQLLAVQRQFALQFGHKVDLYHSEKHRGILVVPHGASLHPRNVIATYQY
jgi:hypothetical protein